ncbi:hypothetical protein [Labrenzia sp. PHM005]|uniref:hypothetical protein n=1 Tax=Labrenzia sp. PHM005 TaxID=2590016 RepID=UPI0011402526|nr:hypothetical protein [Labrenzia sp. PHM005]QDG75178.1 hypothetical protein FJ695_04470 [Labrenzia sp. PHM005]
MLKRLLGDSVALVFGNLETVFKVCGAWFVVQMIVFGAVAALGLQGTAAFVFGLIPILIVSLAASASIAVAWHRFGLLSEYPGSIHLKLGPLEARFILKSLMLTLMMLACGLVLGIFHALTGSASVTGVLAIIFLIVGLPVFLRFSLILPATAVDHDIGLGDAYQMSAGLGWRMFCAIFLLSLPFALIGEALAYLLELSEGGLPVVLIQLKVLILNVLSQIILMVLSISVLTSGFRIAMEREATIAQA